MSYLSETDLHILLNNLFAVIEDAGNGILGIYNNSIEVILKSDKTPLTEADQISNKIICSALHQLTPDIPIISEESKNDAFDQRKNYSYCWIIDPLDGTKEFIKKNDEFSINIALCYQGQIILGMVHSPVYKKTAWAIKGSGAYLKNNEGMVCRLECDSIDLHQPRLRVLTSRSHVSQKTKSFIAKLEDPILLPYGSSWKFIMLANNEADCYPRPGTTMEWDTAAPQIIVEEAGGSVVDLDHKLPLTYNKQDLRNPEFLALGRLSHPL